jgi:BirA family biotin operon repressor/biotin-[acetyl-CoA-carboxylase] ligase
MSKDQADLLVQPAPTPLPFIRTVVRWPVVDSTNMVARSMVLEGVEELPFLVWADKQTQGHGRAGRSWWSDEGSLTFTLAINPTAHGLSLEQGPRLALTAAVAVIDAMSVLKVTNPGIGIRWPNDIEVNGHKLGGILPESIDTESGQRLLIGVGVNVLSRLDQAPLEVQRLATSLSALQPKPLDRSFIASFLAAILQRFEGALYRVAANDPELAQKWNRLNLLHNHIVRVAVGPKTISGRVQGIDAQGALELHDGEQLIRLFGGQVLRGTAVDTD